MNGVMRRRQKGEEGESLAVKWTRISAHGLPRVVGANANLPARVIWLLTTLIALTSMVILGTQVWQQYSTGATTTVISYIPRTPEFPDVKICNRVWFDPEKLINDHNTTDELAILFRQMAVGRGVNKTLEKKLLKSVGEYFYASHSTSFSEKYAFRITDFALQCMKWAQPPNDCSGIFRPVQITDFGLCYTLDPSFSLTGGVGRASTVEMLLYFDPDKHFGQLTKAHGASLIIGNPHDKTKDDAIAINPGESVDVEVSRNVWKQTMSTQQNPCESSPSIEYEVHGESHSIPYNKFHCLTMCENKVALLIHDCFAYAGYMTNETCLDDPRVRETSIKFMNGTLEDRELAHRAESSAIACFAQCKKKCVEHSFDRQVSVIRPFPTEEYLLSVLSSSNGELGRRLYQGVVNSSDQSEALRRVGASVARMAIFLKEESDERVTELVPMHTFSTFLSNVGGSMGLWMGISVISLIELIDCVVATVILLIKKKLNPPHTEI